MKDIFSHQFSRVFLAIGLRGWITVVQLVIGIGVIQVSNTSILGEYYQYFAISNFLGVLFGLGESTRVVSKIAVSHDNEMLSKVFNRLISLLLYQILFVFICVIAYVFYDQGIDIFVLIFIGSILFFTNKYLSDVLRGAGYAKMSIFIETGLFSMLFLLFLFALFIFNISVDNVMLMAGFHMLCIGLSILVASFIVGKRLKFRVLKFEIVSFRSLIGKNYYFWFLQVMNALYAAIPFIVMPLYFSKEEMGWFGVIQRFVGVVATLQSALASIFTKSLSIAANGLEKSKRSLSQSRRYSFTILCSLLLLYFVFGKEVLWMLYSAPVVYWNMLIIMTSIRVFAASFGLVEVFMYMNGNVKYESYIFALSLSVMSLLIVILDIPTMVIFSIIYSSVLLLRAVISNIFIFQKGGLS